MLTQQRRHATDRLWPRSRALVLLERPVLGPPFSSYMTQFTRTNPTLRLNLSMVQRSYRQLFGLSVHRSLTNPVVCTSSRLRDALPWPQYAAQTHEHAMIICSNCI